MIAPSKYLLEPLVPAERAIMKFKRALLLACGLTLAGANAMACYTVYDANSRVLSQGSEAPVDMSLQLHEALATRGFPRGSRMQFDQGSCVSVPVAQVARSVAPDLPPNTIHITRDQRVAKVPEGPLLTEPATAASLGMPHTIVANNIAVVPRSAAGRDTTPAVTVVPATAIASAAVNTTAMGAGPASYDTRVMGGPPARMVTPPARGITVITEYRNGGRTVQRY
jgi:hypothetical protein